MIKPLAATLRYSLWPALPAALISKARSWPVRKSSFDSNSQPIFSVAALTSLSVYVFNAVEIFSLSAKTDRMLASEPTICDHTLDQVSHGD